MKSLKDGRYEMIMSKRLGSGNFADVYLAKDNQTQQEVAIKVIAMDKIRQYGEKLSKAIEKEIYVLKNLTKYDNPYLLRFIDCFDTANNKYLVLEFCNGGTMGDKLKKEKALPESKVLEYAYQMVLGLSALEEAGMSHRDLKPDNVFIHNDICKIGDFGFASHESKFTSSLGTCVYMGPEFYVGKGHMNSKVDVWAFGVTIHQLLFNEFPFDGKSSHEVIQGVINRQYVPPSTNPVGPYTVDMLRRCLEKDPDRRISFRELRTHPAFQPFMPRTQDRLGADVKQSLFYGPAQGNRANVYRDLNVHCVENGYLKPEEPKESEESLIAKKNAFINKILVEYRNAYMFFLEISQNLEAFKDTELCSFYILKRALQRASILLYYIKDENQPPQEILHNTSPTEWRKYTESDWFVNFMPYLIYDIVELRSYFERKYDVLKKLYVTLDPRYAAWINDDLEQSLREALHLFIKETSRLIYKSSTNGTDVAVKLAILNEIDVRDSTCPWLENIRENVEKIVRNDQNAKIRVVEQYLSK